MTSYILVIASVPAYKFEEVAAVSMETHVEYPSFIQKIMDAGENYTNYAAYAVEDANLNEAIKIIAARYHAIAKKIPEYEFNLTPMMDVQDWARAFQ